MSNKTQLLNHNERLASVIQTLQGKASGSVETSDVTCHGSQYVSYTGVENGVLVAKVSVGTATDSSHNIVAVKNTPIVMGYTLNYPAIASHGGVLLQDMHPYFVTFYATASSAVFSVSGGGGGND